MQKCQSLILINLSRRICIRRQHYRQCQIRIRNKVLSFYSSKGTPCSNYVESLFQRSHIRRYVLRNSYHSLPFLPEHDLPCDHSFKSLRQRLFLNGLRRLRRPDPPLTELNLGNLAQSRAILAFSVHMARNETISDLCPDHSWHPAEHIFRKHALRSKLLRSPKHVQVILIPVECTC